jgi:hypothetical protein
MNKLTPNVDPITWRDPLVLPILCTPQNGSRVLVGFLQQLPENMVQPPFKVLTNRATTTCAIYLLQHLSGPNDNYYGNLFSSSVKLHYMRFYCLTKITGLLLTLSLKWASRGNKELI